MVLKFSCSEPRLLTMGVTILKKLVQQAKGTKDVITVEATVVTGFEAQAVEECKEKCKPIDVFKSKGRIFFNINKDSYPKVLKMRSIDNVYLVSDCFDELKLKRVKEEDLATIRKLVEDVEWAKIIPQWAEIVNFTGVQFPKCAQRDPEQPLDESEPACQNCKNPKNGEAILVENDGPVEASAEVENGDPPKGENCGSPVVLISDEDCFQTPPDKCAVLLKEKVDCCSQQGGDCAGKEQSPGAKVDPLADSGDPQPSPEIGREVKTKEETDDEAFHSAEEDLIPEESIPSTVKSAESADALVSSAEDAQPEIGSVTDVRPEPIGSTNEDIRPEPKDEKDDKKKKNKWEKKKEARAKRTERKRTPLDQVSDTSSVAGSDVIEPNDSSGNGPDGDANKTEKRKSHWQKKKEARKAHKAQMKAAKPPRKEYIDDGILKFRVTCHRNGGRHSFDSNDAAGNFGGVINDKFHWTVDLTRFDINVVLVIEDDSAYVSLGLTKSSFHRRNIKNFGATTLRATLCYGLIRFAEPKLGEIIVDPLCGGGSISIEGALAFPKTYHICGDVNDKCMERVADNIAFNSAEKPLMMDGFRWSVRRLPLRDQCVDVVVTDLPFGLRVGKQKDNTGLYIAALFELARVVKCGRGRASLLTYDRTAMIRALQRTRHLWREIQVNAINQVLDLAFDSVGARLAAAEGNGHVQVWDVKKGSELMFCLSGHTCEVSKVCFSPGGGQLLTASSDGTARLWSAKDGRPLQVLDGHSDEVFSCAFSYAGESILTASKDKTCRLWKRQPLIEDE